MQYKEALQAFNIFTLLLLIVLQKYMIICWFISYDQFSILVYLKSSPTINWQPPKETVTRMMCMLGKYIWTLRKKENIHSNKFCIQSIKKWSRVWTLPFYTLSLYHLNEMVDTPQAFHTLWLLETTWKHLHEIRTYWWNEYKKKNKKQAVKT